MVESKCFLKNLVRPSGLASLLSLLFSAGAALAQNSQVTLAWNPSAGVSLSGYRIYQGGVSGNYTNQINLGNVTTATVSNLTAGATYYFAVTALSSSGLESSRSGEISFTATTSTSVPPSIVITSPKSGANYTAPATVSISASVVTNGHPITKVQFYNGSTLLGEDTTTPYVYTANSVAAGTYTITAKLVYDAGSTIASSPVSITVNPGSVGPPATLPAPWVAANVGTVSASGSASASNNIYTVSGAGNVSGTADNFQFVYQPMTGDGEIRAQIKSVQNTTGTGGIVGVMIRETLTSSSSFVCMGTAPNGTGYAWYRNGTGTAVAGGTSGAAAPPNAWVRLVRSGSTFYGYASADGVNWTLINSGPVSMASNIYFGLVVASGGSSLLNTSTFGNVTAVP